MKLGRGCNRHLVCMLRFAVASLIFGPVAVLAQVSSELILKDARLPAHMEFLRTSSLPADLATAVLRDTVTLSKEEAAQKIIHRLRLHVVAVGAYDPLAAAQIIGLPSDGVTPPPRIEANELVLKKWRQTLAIQSRSSNPRMDAVDVGVGLSEHNVLSITEAMYGPLGRLLQIRPGIPFESNSDESASAPASTSASALGIGAVTSTTRPGPSVDALSDCETPFEQLEKTCNAQRDGFRCEQFIRKEFSEVARIATAAGTCTGTLIAPRWVISAAHCFAPEQSASSYLAKNPMQLTAHGDMRLSQEELNRIEIHFDHTSRGGASKRAATEVIIPGYWDPVTVIASNKIVSIGKDRFPPDFRYLGDMALIKLKDEDALEADVKPASIPQEEYSGVVTTAGYGITNVGDGTAGKLFVTWPDPSVVATSQSQLELAFETVESGREKPVKLISTFCAGDSGGPAFASRHRGCQPRANFERPRNLVGIISYYWGYNNAASNAEQSNICQKSPIMRFVNVAAAKNRRWVCTATGGAVRDC